MIPKLAPATTRLARRWIGTHGLARSAATRSGRVHRPAWPVAPSRARHLGIIALAASALFASGCGSSQEGDYGGKHPDYARALAGSPAPLAALHRQADRLLSGGRDAFEARLARLRGYPVVVNVWASWCGPCRFEFPLFQQVAAALGRRVAFLGLDSDDSDAAARTFLAEAPVPYPSYTDPDKAVAESVGAKLGFPDTAFYDRRGELVYLKQGPYRDRAELRADVERYGLRGGREGG
jgi:cytochrome c biogenesis protein CcmG, thiol:disulfide interchange protein DsbE